MYTCIKICISNNDKPPIKHVSEFINIQLHCLFKFDVIKQFISLMNNSVIISILTKIIWKQILIN